MVVMSLRYFDSVQPSTKWEVVLYVDERGDDTQRAALADIFLGRAGGTVAELYGPAIGEVHAVARRASPSNTSLPANESVSSATSPSRAQAPPPSVTTFNAESRALITPVLSST